MSPLTIDTPVEQLPRTRPPGDRLPPRPPVDDGDGDGSPGPPPRPLLDNVRLAMLFFLSAETMLFGAFVSGFFVLRLAAPQWPPPLQPRLPVIVTGLNTFVLMTSSAALIAAMAGVPPPRPHAPGPAASPSPGRWARCSWPCRATSGRG